jgi:hypothetical protein
MRPLGVVVDEPGVEIGLERLDAVVEGLAHLHREELVEDGAVEALDEAVGFRRPDPCAAVLDAVEVEIGLVGVVLGAAELPAVARWEWIAGDRLWPPAESLR